MAQIPVQMPVVQMPGSASSPTTVSLTASSHVNDGDIVVLSSGQIATATANVSGNIAGIAQHDSNANFGGGTGINVTIGSTQVGTGLFPASPGQTIVVPLGSPAIVAINLTATTGWISGGTQQANIGTQVGLAIDGTTGFFLADPTASNKVATIVGIQDGVVLGGTESLAGNLGARVYVAFLSSALAIQQGQ